MGSGGSRGSSSSQLCWWQISEEEIRQEESGGKWGERSQSTLSVVIVVFVTIDFESCCKKHFHYIFSFDMNHELFIIHDLSTTWWGGDSLESLYNCGNKLFKFQIWGSKSQKQQKTIHVEKYNLDIPILIYQFCYTPDISLICPRFDKLSKTWPTLLSI